MSNNNLADLISLKAQSFRPLQEPLSLDYSLGAVVSNLKVLYTYLATWRRDDQSKA